MKKGVVVLCAVLLAGALLPWPSRAIPLPQALPVELEWNKNTFTVAATSNQVISPPVVADITADGVPEVIFTTYENGDYGSNGILRAVHGEDGSDVFNVTDAGLRLRPLSGLVVIDLENDGTPEIVAEASAGGLYAFDNTGNLRYTSVPTFTVHPGEGSIPLAADLDGDSFPEIVVGRYVLDHTLRHVTDLGSGDTTILGATVGDVDLEGNAEIIVGNTIYHANGTLLAHNDALPAIASTALGNFDSDPYPEIVLVAPMGGTLYLLDHQLGVIWGPQAVPGGSGYPANGGPVTIADFDGDGASEIAVVGASQLTVFDGDGSVVWQVASHDTSSGFTVSAAFDFSGDGAAEVAYGDEVSLRILNGPDGAVLFNTPHASITGFEIPVVADVDADGHAEMVVVENDYYCGEVGCQAGQHGLRVFGGGYAWPGARPLWNQHNYDISGVDDELRVVSPLPRSWQTHNTFRAQRAIYSLFLPLNAKQSGGR